MKELLSSNGTGFFRQTGMNLTGLADQEDFRFL
jgi:hypothetical protein